ncbi:MAG: twin-arginine translocase TatA/TatE family subunit [Phycisphaerales bacterium JB065]
MTAIFHIALPDSNPTLAFIGMPGGMEWIVVLIIGLLLFGRRLPEVGRGVGKTIVEFRKGIAGIEDEIEDAAKKSGSSTPKSPEQLPSAQARSEMVQPDGRSVSQEPAMPARSNGEPEPQGG